MAGVNPPKIRSRLPPTETVPIIRSYLRRLPRVNDIGSEYDVVASPLERHLLSCPVNMKRHLQTTFDQHGDRGAVSICPGAGSLVAVWMNAPLELDVGLVSQSELGRNKLADEPSAAAHLVGLCIAKVEAGLVAHSHSRSNRRGEFLMGPPLAVGARTRRR